jgi:hypothetical protein
MTAHASIKDALIAQGRTADEVYRALCAFTARDPMAVVVACDFMLERLQDRLPAPQMLAASPYWSQARDEARLWTEVASDAQVIGMLVACIDRLDGASAAQKDRDALMVALWNAAPEPRRKAFLALVAGPENNEAGK